MALSTYYTKGVDISQALTKLEALGSDEYFVAFGTGGRQFCGTPNGYSAVHLPAKIVRDLSTGRAKVKKIVWASFGTHSDSWFFRYKTRDGRSLSQYGKAAPAALRQFIEESYISTSPHLFASLHVQLGDNDSFLAWTRCLWICHRVPIALKEILVKESVQCSQSNEGLAKGVFKYSAPTHISWHANGSYYYQTDEGHLWNFQSNTAQEGWTKLWHDHKGDTFSASDLADLAFAGLDPHSADGDNFVFIKKRKGNNEADFALRFSPEGIICRVASRDAVGKAPKERHERFPTSGTDPRPDERLQCIPQLPKEPETFRWAQSKNTGRPNPRDNWELAMEKGEMVKVLEEQGRDWYVVQNARGMQGFAHKTWLNFKIKIHSDPQDAYVRFSDEMDLLLKSGTLRQFPDLSIYMNACDEDGCKTVKETDTGIAICAHDLERLLRGSGAYTVDFLKSERNMWHPDKFARYCHPKSRDDLKAKAESLFVLFGVLIDHLQQPPRST